jgi:hypothetical protein
MDAKDAKAAKDCRLSSERTATNLTALLPPMSSLVSSPGGFPTRRPCPTTPVSPPEFVSIVRRRVQASRGFPLCREGVPLEVHLLSVAVTRPSRRGAAAPHLVYPLARGWEAVSQSTHLGIGPQWGTRQLSRALASGVPAHGRAPR